MSAYQILEIDGVDGESVVTNFEDKIDCMSWSWGCSMPTSLGGGTGGGVAKANFGDLTIMKSTDKASGALFLACASGKHYDKVTLHLLKAGGDDPVEYMKIELEDVMVTSLQCSDSSGGSQLPTESVSLAYNVVTLTYTPQADAGGGESPTPIGWDVACNKKK